ncbi:MAG: TonB-dependent receptor plug domain-containing protein [Burkholderiaceae bacterium]|nr:TonB-dependent receptor plug domain-containing protein [Burkholderiaceae bacterium]
MDDSPPAAELQRVGAQGARVDERLAWSGKKIAAPQEETFRYADRTRADELKRLPTLTVSSTDRVSEVRMRGPAAGYTQLLLNGSPVPTGLSVDAITRDAIERIDIIRSSTAELGAKGMARTVNIVQKQSTAKASAASTKFALDQEAGRQNIQGKLVETNSVALDAEGDSRESMRTLDQTLSAIRTRPVYCSDRPPPQCIGA